MRISRHCAVGLIFAGALAIGAIASGEPAHVSGPGREAPAGSAGSKDSYVFLGVVATAALGLLNLFYSFGNNRRTSYVSAVTATRLKWIGEVRQNLARFVTLVSQWTVAPPHDPAERLKVFQEIVYLRMLLRLSLAPKAPAPCDEKFERKIESLIQDVDQMNTNEIESKLKDLV